MKLKDIAKIPSMVSGEMSKLRMPTVSGFRFGSIGNAYTLDTEKVNYELARSLYDNTNEDYKLGAWSAKPVINTCVGFMGVPRFKAADPEAQLVLDAFQTENVSLQQQTHRDALRDGDCLVWLTREENEETKALYPEDGGAKIVYNIVPPEKLSAVGRDPITGKIVEYIFKTQHEWTNEKGNKNKCVIIEKVSAKQRVVSVEGPAPEGLQVGEFKNNWGFIAIEKFSNEKESSAANGRSDLEPIEPLMKAYHDVMLHAIKGSKMHSTPRLKLRLKDVAGFLLNNFNVTDPAKFAKEGKTITLEGHELLVFQDGEDADFIEVKSATGDAKILLQLLFYCVVTVSETPEFAFGVHTPSSQASVKEQMPVLARRVARKRDHFTASWVRLARMVLSMHSLSTGKKFVTHEVEIIWDEVDPKDDKHVADAIAVLVKALCEALQNELISREAAVNFLARHIDTMGPYVDDDDPDAPNERDRIIRDKIMNSKLGDEKLADDEQKLIEQALAERNKSKNT